MYVVFVRVLCFVLFSSHDAIIIIIILVVAADCSYLIFFSGQRFIFLYGAQFTLLKQCVLSINLFMFFACILVKQEEATGR